MTAPLTLDDLKQRDMTAMEPAMSTINRIRIALDDYEASIKTCAYDKRSAVLNRLARETINGIAGLAENETHEASTDVAACAEYLTDAITSMFIEAASKAEDRRSERAA